MPHPFLSDEWMAEAKAIRQRYAGQTGTVTQSLKINQVVTDAPFGEGTVQSHIDTSSGDFVMDLGHLDDAEADPSLGKLAALGGVMRASGTGATIWAGWLSVVSAESSALTHLPNRSQPWTDAVLWTAVSPTAVCREQL